MLGAGVLALEQKYLMEPNNPRQRCLKSELFFQPSATSHLQFDDIGRQKPKIHDSSVLRPERDCMNE